MINVKKCDLRDNSTLKLIALLLGLLLMWSIAVKNQANFLWFIFVGILSILYILKNKNIERIDIITGVILGAISMPANFIMGITTVIAYIGATSVFKNSNNKILLYKRSSNVFIPILFTLVFGGVLGAINLWLARNSISFNTSIKFGWFLEAFKAGITEEVIFRFFFFAVCVRVVKDKQLSKFENFICYLIMIVPHVLLHFNINTFNLASVVILSLLFGLPFAIFQRKRDLLSAMLCHMFVDLIRFCLIGV